MSMMLLMTGAQAVEPPALPTPIDATAASMRPNGRCLAVITVAVLPGAADHSSITAAIAEAKMIQQAQRTIDGPGELGPNFRVDIIINDGVYTETVDVSDWVNLYGVGSGKVSVSQLNSNAKRGTFEGTHHGYVEGITIKRTSTAPAVNVYPVHTANSHTSIWVDVVFDNFEVVGGLAFGSDGGENGYTCFYRCRFVGGTNIHGSAAQALAKIVAFIQCVGTALLGFNSMHPTAPDHVWVVGTTAVTINVQGAGTTLHISGSPISGAVVAAGTQDTRSDWPVPTGGLSAYDRAYYGM